MLSLDRRGRMRISSGAAVPACLDSYYSMDRREYSFPMCGDIARRLIEADPGLEISDALSARYVEIRSHQNIVIAIAEAKDWDGDPRLFPYQRVGVEWLRQVGRGILADEQGLGKTVMAVVAAASLNPDRCVIICPTSIINVWAEHLMEWNPGSRRWLLGETKREETLSWWREVGGYLITNYDRAEIHASDLDADLVIIDEAHRSRNRKTNISATVRRIARRAERLFLLTASPTVNSLSDMWPLLNMCDPKRFGSFWGFAFRFCDIDDSGFGLKIRGIRQGEQENLDRILKPYVLHRRGMLGLNPSEYRVIPYVMTGEQKRLYEEMRDSGICGHGHSEVEALDVLAQITRLRQLALSPALLFPDYDGMSKTDYLPLIVNEWPGQVVVFTTYAQLVSLAIESLRAEGTTATPMTGEMSTVQRDESLGRFRSGEARVIVVTHGTGGEGLTLTEADRAIFLDLAWHPAGNEHAARRILRHGQRSDKTQIIIIHSVGTIEDHVREIISEKRPVTISEILRRDPSLSRAQRTLPVRSGCEGSI
jgi:SNF2 family DNA or RNA helicase